MAWMIRPVLPAGTSFNGQMVYNMTNFELDDTFAKRVDSMSISKPGKYVNKYTGFETTKYRILNTTGNDITSYISIMLVGNLDRWWCQALHRLAIGINGAGMEINFRDTWATAKQYRGKWVNAGDFVDSSELLCGASMEIEAYEEQSI